ncbi:hypothetical protein Herbaro_05395 [Herbaspirillum sp. WKF16]|uniref:hypothetical protein n=1 Tax=Herbaspirillum sp. WKF16 TaxID=3028312 RepID=UPI0023A93E0A|nr:hypothetical protein [Herbaspirillum sp. WKF16]WDZ97227.1 hypothetical protein Herbaro_05395 [Herbaspirillum sp. WKF16]
MSKVHRLRAGPRGAASTDFLPTGRLSEGEASGKPPIEESDVKSNADKRFSQDEIAHAIEHHLREHGDKGIAHSGEAISSAIGAKAVAFREKKALWPRRKVPAP